VIWDTKLLYVQKADISRHIVVEYNLPICLCSVQILLIVKCWQPLMFANLSSELCLCQNCSTFSKYHYLV